MSKAGQLIKNTAIIGLGTLSTKVLTFLLLPIYTTLLAPEDYGVVDVLMTVASLIIPIATLEICSGVFRFLIESDNENYIGYGRSRVLSTSFFITASGLFVTTILLLLLNQLFAVDYSVYFWAYIVSLAVSGFCMSAIRGLGDITTYSIASFFVTAVTLILNILLVAVLKKNAGSILIATAVGNFAGAAYVVYKGKLWRYISMNDVSKQTSTAMLRYTVPLIPNTVSWWVVSASNRVIILAFLTPAANGIFSAAAKIPGIYTTIFSVFGLAWSEAVSRNIDDEEFVTETIHKATGLMLLLILGITSCSSLFFHILIGEAYADSYFHIIFLLGGAFFSSMSSLYGGIFSAKFESKLIATTTIVGAAVSVLLTVCLIRVIGLYAASGATVVSYMVVTGIRKKTAAKWLRLKKAGIQELIFLPLIGLATIGYIQRSTVINIISVISIIVVFFVYYRDEVTGILKKFKK